MPVRPTRGRNRSPVVRGVTPHWVDNIRGNGRPKETCEQKQRTMLAALYIECCKANGFR
jgi:hypothetical protein